MFPSFLPFHPFLLPPFLFSPSCANAEIVSQQFLPSSLFWFLTFHLFLVFLLCQSCCLEKKIDIFSFFILQEEEIWYPPLLKFPTIHVTSTYNMCASLSHLHLSKTSIFIIHLDVSWPFSSLYSSSCNRGKTYFLKIKRKTCSKSTEDHQKSSSVSLFRCISRLFFYWNDPAILSWQMKFRPIWRFSFIPQFDLIWIYVWTKW